MTRRDAELEAMSSNISSMSITAAARKTPDTNRTQQDFISYLRLSTRDGMISAARRSRRISAPFIKFWPKNK